MLLLMISKGNEAYCNISVAGQSAGTGKSSGLSGLEIGACAYLILKSGSDAMDGTDDEHHQQIAEYCQFPRLEDLQVEEFPIVSS